MDNGNHLIDQLAATARRDPDRVFAELPGGGTLSLGGLFGTSARMAAALVAGGLRPGDRVAVQAEKTVEYLMLYLATVMAGAVFLPLNTAYTPREMALFLSDAEPAVVVTDPARAADLRPLAGAARLLTLDAAGQGSLTDAAGAAAPEFFPVPRGAEDLAAILYTSGTTGRSKGAMLSHRALASNAGVLAEVWGFAPADVLIHALPVFHTHGLFVATNVALVSGCRLIFQPRFDAAAVLAALPRASVLMGVPTFYTRLLAEPGLTREACAPMRLFISGSAPLLSETHKAWEARTGHAILERYGMTETGMNTSNPLHGPRRAGTVGFPLPGVELRIADPATGAPLPRGETGGIELRGPNLFSGYWRMPEKTAEEMRPDGFFITGDVGVIDAEGCLSIVGRARDLIISGGFNIYPKEIEALIDALPGVAESAVIGLPHPDFGEVVAAVVVPAPGAALSEDGIRAAIAPGLARFKQPRRVVIVPDLPRNAMGKVQKAELRRTYAKSFTA